MLLFVCSTAFAQTAPSIEGKNARPTLTSALSSRLPAGSQFTARLDQPVEVNGEVALPLGTMFQGRVETKRARRLMRRGALRLVFETMTLPDQSARSRKLYVSSVESKDLKTGAEGMITQRLTKKSPHTRSVRRAAATFKSRSGTSSANGRFPSPTD